MPLSIQSRSRKETATKAPRARRQQKNRISEAVFDYHKSIPDWVRAAIDEHMGHDLEDARHAGALGFMARALVMATMPYKDPKADAFNRNNGEFHLRILAGYRGGIPYGVYPRLLLSWVTTEAVRSQTKRTPVLAVDAGFPGRGTGCGAAIQERASRVRRPPGVEFTLAPLADIEVIRYRTTASTAHTRAL